MLQTAVRWIAIASVVLCASSGMADLAPFDAKSRVADLDFLVDQIAARYAYLPERMIDLEKVKALYEPRAEAAATRAAFIGVIEGVMGELHDHHATLGVNTPSSPQLVPTGADLWAEMKSGHAVIEEVRAGSAAARAHIRAGDEVLAIQGAPVAQTVARIEPKTLIRADPEATNWALRTLLAGTHDRMRVLTIRARDGRTRTMRLGGAMDHARPAKGLVTWRRIGRDIGYVRIENSLGDSDAVAAFDEALDHLRDVKGLILDLRNTPSGGDSDVAEPMLGRFIESRGAYQRVFEPAQGKNYPQDSWLKMVEPRGPVQVKASLVVLVDHWTGSMGEGMTIGLDALHRATIVGTDMARLRGGTSEFTLPNSGISVHLPTERLYHVNGVPREAFVPMVFVDLRKARGADPILARGLKLLRHNIATQPRPAP